MEKEGVWEVEARQRKRSRMDSVFDALSRQKPDWIEVARRRKWKWGRKAEPRRATARNPPLGTHSHWAVAWAPAENHPSHHTYRL